MDLKKTGIYPYAEAPTTDVICLAYAFDDEDVELWLPGQAIPQRIIDHIAAGGEMRAWNAAFERIIWRAIMVKRYGAPTVCDEQWHDTAAEAAAMALPRSLDQAAKVTGVAEQKDDKGYRLMLQMSKPRRIEEDGTIVWWNTPAKLAILYEYCRQDVKTERAIGKVIRRLTPRERAVYLLDQRMNDRGVRFDRELVNAAQRIADEGTERANVVLRQLTNGTVSEVTNHARLTAWLQSQGVETDSVDKLSVKTMLEGEDLTPVVRAALEARADAGRTSVAKLRSYLEASCSDDRLRGLLLYHAASTGRWAGRLLQPQNFPRGEVDDVESYIPAVLAGDYDWIDLFAHPIVVISSLLRSMMTSGPGKELIVADFSAIEARVVNWLAGQHDIVKLFRDGVDVYKYNATKLFGISYEEVQKFPHRQTGKFQELGCGFGMGAKKGVETAHTAQYGYLVISEERMKEIVNNYRATHGQVKKFWKDAETAVKTAIKYPMTPVPFGAVPGLKAIVAGAYLYIVLPSGRPLAYAAPRLILAPPPWGGEDIEQIEYSAPIGPAKRWGRERTYGGKLVENIVQAVARDLMAEAMLRAEERGYTPILSVHDEVVAEVEKGFGSVEEFEQLMCELPAWAEGCPVAAEGWRGERYRK